MYAASLRAEALLFRVGADRYRSGQPVGYGHHRPVIPTRCRIANDVESKECAVRRPQDEGNRHGRKRRGHFVRVDEVGGFQSFDVAHEEAVEPT